MTICDKCKKKVGGLFSSAYKECNEDGCPATICTDCNEKFKTLVECPDCEALWCKSHLKHEHEDEDSDERDIEREGDYAIIKAGNYEYNTNILRDVSKLEIEGYEVIKWDWQGDNLILLKKKR